MAVEISAQVLTGLDPQRVQVLLTGIDEGVEFSVVGSTAAGDRWTVPGGVGVGTGDQIKLTDARAALNVSVTYAVTVAGAVTTTAPVMVASAYDFVLQDLRGDVIVPFFWVDNADPREPTSGAVLSTVPGRRRPGGSFETGTDGGGEWQILTSAVGSKALHEMVVESRPVVMRTSGEVRDIPAVEIAVLRRAPNALFSGDGGASARRVWSLTYELMDDPEPYTALIVITVDDVVTHFAGVTVAEVVSDFAGLTVDDFAAFDFKQVRGA